MSEAKADALTEWEYGSGAVHMACKMFVRSGLPHLIGAVGYRLDDPKKQITRPGNDLYERWDGELIIVPHRKFDGDAAGGMRIDQLVCSNLLNNDDAWHEYWNQTSAT